MKSMPESSAVEAAGLPRSAATPAAHRLKRAVDVVAATLALVLLSVLLAMTALAILILEGRPILIRHQRIGRNGARFACLKFRTMVVNADEVLTRHLAEDPAALCEWHARRKLTRDPRVTPLGRVLRETSLDELPQLINILRGEMSLVGPRPIVAEEIPRYGAAFADYKSVRPGLTGLWQCSGRNDVSYEQRVKLDRAYVRTWSLMQDIRIILRTIPAVISSRGVY
ncbi:sugar transferase [Methylobacterium nodulans]|uniref:Sugar transferase n=1 Tax=Methylobacterium nodulans (strain LMG 21967 / CNCM I-2342 / ORS 2060) TaxID=460265 RepID=B8IGI1_METNO|nr:sugar transferase [Methylobacterium nodulans ORS 2060]ACL55896.1 sugar transferase [Methylobacterium nodulans ORS 2060]